VFAGKTRGAVRRARRLHPDLFGQAPAGLHRESIPACRPRAWTEIACTSVNDVFVMGAWGKDQGAGDAVLMLADGNGDFASALGLEMDGSAFGMGKRSQRYALVVNDKVIEHLFVDEPGNFEVSSAEHVLSAL
jgi:peroxiredoxin